MHKEIIFTFTNNYSHKTYQVTLEDIMFMIVVFEHVRSVIEEDKDEYMCLAIDYTLADNPLLNSKARDNCKRYIESSLCQSEYNYTMFNWLEENGYVDPSYELGKQARILWLDKTIARFTEILKEHHYPF